MVGRSAAVRGAGPGGALKQDVHGHIAELGIFLIGTRLAFPKADKRMDGELEA